MSKDQIKQEINKVLDQLSDRGLEEVLHLLKKLDHQSGIQDDDIVRKILQEDNNLLARLAQ